MHHDPTWCDRRCTPAASSKKKIKAGFFYEVEFYCFWESAPRMSLLIDLSGRVFLCLRVRLCSRARCDAGVKLGAKCCNFRIKSCGPSDNVHSYHKLFSIVPNAMTHHLYFTLSKRFVWCSRGHWTWWSCNWQIFKIKMIFNISQSWETHLFILQS